MLRALKPYLPVVAAVIVGAGLLALTIDLTGDKDATDTENALWTFILFAIGVGVSYYLGKRSVREAASDVVRPQARGATRRLVTLGKGIQSFVNVIDLHRDAAHEIAAENGGKVPMEQLDLAFDTLYVQIESQMSVVNDALEDWREFTPEIVNELTQPDIPRGTDEGA